MSYSLEKIVIATGNAGKLREIRQMLEGSGITVLPQSDFSVPDADETGLSFIENAILKARHAAKLTGLPALADDSGLEVDALGGEPGIYSARYAGAGAGDAANNAKLVAALKALPPQKFTARFQCVMAFVRHASDPVPLIAQGSWDGEMVLEPRGENGFGYDPLFWVPEKGCCSAELSKDEKNALSHRGKALQQMVAMLRERARV